MEAEPLDSPLSCAVAYAREGWAVLPIAPGKKFPLCSHGVHDASKKLTQIREWWGRWPNANIGIACGKWSDLVVLDIDPRNGGVRSFETLVDEYGDLPHTRQVSTGGGGMHWYYRYPAGRDTKKGVLAEGVDLVSDGGYVIAPPSDHPSGGTYEWLTMPVEIPVLPEWIVKLRNKTPENGDFAFCLPDPGEGISAGMRNQTLIRIAGSMRRWGLSDKAINAALQVHNQEACDPPLPELEVQDISRSITRYEPSVEVEDGQNEPNEGPGVSIEDRPMAS